MDNARKLKFSSYVHLPFRKYNFLISLCLSDSVQCRRGYYLRARAIYLSFGPYQDVNIKQLCSSGMQKPNFQI